MNEITSAICDGREETGTIGKGLHFYTQTRTFDARHLMRALMHYSMKTVFKELHMLTFRRFNPTSGNAFEEEMLSADAAANVSNNNHRERLSENAVKQNVSNMKNDI